MMHNGIKSRTRSAQFYRSGSSIASHGGSDDRTGTPPVPGTRTSSIPSTTEDKDDGTSPSPIIRHYRSMLDVEAAPQLPVAELLSYDELYPSQALTGHDDGSSAAASKARTKPQSRKSYKC